MGVPSGDHWRFPRRPYKVHRSIPRGPQPKNIRNPQKQSCCNIPKPRAPAPANPESMPGRVP
eukprot:2697372-Pyramimonas_sp.AAC.1